MHYQTRLLPLDAQHFLVAICHGEHIVGGEDTRETSHARIALGRSNALDQLHELSTAVFPIRQASSKAVSYLHRMAKTQEQLAAGHTGARSEDYRANHLKAMHAAHLAGRDGIRVPRRVLVSHTGRVALGFGPTNPSDGECLAGLLRVFDAPSRQVIGDWTSSRFPVEGPGEGIERFFNTQIASPLSLSADGERVLLRQGLAEQSTIVQCLLDRSLTPIGRTKLNPHAQVLPTTHGWIAVDFETVQYLDHDLQLLATMALPDGAQSWGAVASTDGDALLLPTMAGGDFWLLRRDGTKPRRYTAHRGARRDAYPRLAICDHGEWIASRCERDIVVTRISDGTSRIVATLEDHVDEASSYGGYVVKSFVPSSFGFVGERLLVSDAAGIREVQLGNTGAEAFVSETGRPGAREAIHVQAGTDFDALMCAARLDGVAAALHEYYSPAVSIKSTPLGEPGWYAPHETNAPKLGSSRLGGWRDLPVGMEWPTWQGRPMAFLVQIDLADIAEVEPAARLPAHGLLLFFVGCDEESYQRGDDPRERLLVNVMIGTEPDHEPGWRVLYFPQGTHLQRRTYTASPLPELYEPHAVRLAKGGLPLPDEQTAIYPHLPLDAAQRDDYNDLISQLQPTEYGEQLMGYPSLIQSTPPELMCELAATGRDPWTFPKLRSPEWIKLSHTASAWTLLLQLTSRGPFEWGDAGHFYFYGDRLAMARGDFSKIWVNFEC